MKAKKMEGNVKYYSVVMGFGFIRSAIDNKKYYVHVSGLKDLIKAGDRVRFELFEHENGLRAINVKQVDQKKIKGPLKSIKNKLRKISLKNCTSLTSLEGLEEMYLIEDIDIKGCNNLNNTVELSNLCFLNNVKMDSSKKG